MGHEYHIILWTLAVCGTYGVWEICEKEGKIHDIQNAPVPPLRSVGKQTDTPAPGVARNRIRTPGMSSPYRHKGVVPG